MIEIGDPSRSSWRELVDIGLVTLIYYYLILLMRGTQGRVGDLRPGGGASSSTTPPGELGFSTLNWLLTNFLGSIFLVVIILFQKDIRKALAQVGAGRLWRRTGVKDEFLDEMVVAVSAMAKARTGSIIVLERNDPLGDIMERGVEMDAVMSKALLMTIFQQDTPLHDGAVVIKAGRIAAASCILPLSAGLGKQTAFGTRHRAALGISEESDAIVVVVSEERGEISVAMNGKLITGLDEKRLRRILKNALGK